MSYHYYETETVGFESIVGMKFISIIHDGDEINFVRDDGVKFQMYHSQDCCESVYVESIVGDLSDLINTPILMAEESTNDELSIPEDEYDEGCSMWTFYKLATIKGYVDIRWFGSSNGYYGVGVDFVKVKETN